jgi:hypothetical protein
MTGLLAVAAAATIGSHGVSATLPPGWHGRAGHGYLEASTVSLAPEHGYIGTSTRRLLRRGDVLVTLFENTGAIALSPVPQRRPRPFRADELRGHTVRNFRIGRRVFSVFLDTGRGGAARRLGQANRLLASLRVRQGAFYPGIARPPRFAPRRGWHTGTTKPQPAAAVDQAEAWAATVPYLDGPYQLPPHRTLARLGPRGIAIQVTAWRDDRLPPSRRRSQPPFRMSSCGWGGFEGAPQYPLCTIEGDRTGQYDVELRIFFGRATHPTRGDRARAQAELDRLRLPAWPRF